VTYDEIVKWENVWFFLSSDCAIGCFDELWIPRQLAEMRQEIRTVVDRLIDVDYSIEGADIAHNRLMNITFRHGGYELIDRLQHWSAHVFEHGGGERIQSDLWFHILLHGGESTPLVSAPRGIAVQIDAFRSYLREAHTARQVQLTQRLALGHSDWDMRINTRYDGSYTESPMGEGLLDSSHVPLWSTMELILSSNDFAVGWRKCLAGASEEDLAALYRTVLSQQAALRLDNVHFDFPGVWDFTLARYLQAERSN
jgi:hypothetical protein